MSCGALRVVYAAPVMYLSSAAVELNSRTASAKGTTRVTVVVPTRICGERRVRVLVGR